MRVSGLFVLVFGGLSGCASLVPPPRPLPLVYDFGPGAVVPQASNRMAPLPPLALASVQANAALDTTAVLYRLAYSDPQQLRPYTMARWSMPPAELLRLRLRETLGQRRAVLQVSDGVAAPAGTLTLRVDLDEFSQLFDTASSSTGLVRLRATLSQTEGVRDTLLAQRSLVVQRPGVSADAPGGVKAMADATDAAIAELEQWIAQVSAAGGAR